MTISTISTTLTTSVTPGSGNYASGITITNTGGIVDSGTALVIEPGDYASNAGYIRSSISYGAFLTGGSLNNAGGFIYGSGAKAGVSEIDNAVVVNSGTIAGLATGEGVGVNIYDNSTLTNLGRISASVGIDIVGPGKAPKVDVVNNSGSIHGSFAGIVVNPFSEIENSGVITASKYYGVSLGQGSLSNSGFIYGAKTGVNEFVGGTYIGYVSTSGTIAGGSFAVYSYGSLDLTVDPGAVFTGAVEDNIGKAHLILAAGTGAGSLDLGGSFSGFNEITFASAADWTLEGSLAELAGHQTISGFTIGDTIFLDGFTATSDSYVSGTRLVVSNGSTIETLGITGDFAADAFTVRAEPEGTEIVVCYLRGSKILTRGGEVAVEALQIGDFVVTRFNGLQPVKWIGRQSYAKYFVQDNRAQIPVCIGAGALGNGLPLRDLYVSPGHSILLGGTLVLAEFLVNGVTIRQDFVPDEIHYYHIELETHDCVLAEGSWAETYADCSGLRGKFHNAAAFREVYPDFPERAVPALCAPRPMDGVGLDAVLTPVAALAAAKTSSARLRGWVDYAGPENMIMGWAQDEENPELPVLLEIVFKGQVIAQILARAFREDLQTAGIGQGKCGFLYRTPAAISPETMRLVEVRFAASKAMLPFVQSHSCREVPLRSAAVGYRG